MRQYLKPGGRPGNSSHGIEHELCRSIGSGRDVISLDWTLVHYKRGPYIYGTTKSYDYMAWQMGRLQAVVTAVHANRQRIDGIGMQIREPRVCKEEETELKAAVQAS